METNAFTLNILISNTASEPIYEQIYRQIKAHIIGGAIGEGEALPSIRGLAKDLRISVITTKRAYDELEREGYINTVAGRGCFVAKTNPLLIKEENLRKIEQHLEAITELCTGAEVSKEQLIGMLNTLEMKF